MPAWSHPVRRGETLIKLPKVKGATMAKRFQDAYYMDGWEVRRRNGMRITSLTGRAGSAWYAGYDEKHKRLSE